MQPLNNPFGTRLLSMSQVRSVTDVSGTDNLQWRERANVNAMARPMLLAAPITNARFPEEFSWRFHQDKDQP
ncbi:MAG TPA: hypothetical protein VKS24_12445 [Bradyrhizobium sp.]|nr:hypothetical protein [Bradyrhizobium sp.]